MILGAEIGMLIFGLMALIRGKLTLSKKSIVYGPMARVLGIVAMLPLPLSFAIGLLIGIALAAQGKRFEVEQWRGTFAIIEIGLIVACLVAVYAIGWSFAQPPYSAMPEVEVVDD